MRVRNKRCKIIEETYVIRVQLYNEAIDKLLTLYKVKGKSGNSVTLHIFLYTFYARKGAGQMGFKVRRFHSFIPKGATGMLF